MRGHDFHTTLAEGVLFENGHYQFISRIDQRYGTLKGGDGESLDRNTRVIRNAPYFSDIPWPVPPRPNLYTSLNPTGHKKALDRQG